MTRTISEITASIALTNYALGLITIEECKAPYFEQLRRLEAELERASEPSPELLEAMAADEAAARGEEAWEVETPDFRRTAWKATTRSNGDRIEFAVCESLEGGRWEGFVSTRKIPAPKLYKVHFYPNPGTGCRMRTKTVEAATRFEALRAVFGSVDAFRVNEVGAIIDDA